MEERQILVGSFRSWSEKKPSERAKTYREEVGTAYLDVKAELETLARAKRRVSPPKKKVTQEQQMARDLQRLFCGGRYRSWRPWMADLKPRKTSAESE
jgi:ABC-type nitrate/sulfonate/bicarbonate transport system substrate-binding protein